MFYSYNVLFIHVILPQKCPQNLSSWIVVFVASHLCLRKISQKIRCSFWTPTKNLLERKKNKKSCILFKICSILVTTLCIPDTHTQTHTHTHTHTLKLTHTHTHHSLTHLQAHINTCNTPKYPNRARDWNPDIERERHHYNISSYFNLHQQENTKMLGILCRR
jgi:ABC-type nickel/cobalt efflux system permease component RcnA